MKNVRIWARVQTIGSNWLLAELGKGGNMAKHPSRRFLGVLERNDISDSNRRNSDWRMKKRHKEIYGALRRERNIAVCKRPRWHLWAISLVV